MLGQCWPLVVILKQPRTDADPLAPRIRQCCFLCLRRKGQPSHAVLVPCLRPKPSRTWSDSEISEWRQKRIADGSFDSDSTIYKNLREVCYQHQPRLKKWIPFYGIADVREVKFYSQDEKDEFNRSLVDIFPLDIDRIHGEDNKTIIKNRMRQSECHYDVCTLRRQCKDCERYRKDTGGMWENYCPAPKIRAAKRRQQNCRNYSLLRECARYPQKSDNYNYKTLDGMAQESPIIHLEEHEIDDNKKIFEREDQLPGLEYIMGWQFDRIQYELPWIIFWTLLAALSIWVSVIAGGLAGEWGISTAFGQMSLASLAIIVGFRYLL